MIVLLDTSPLTNANSIRGVGVYTRFLSRELKKLETNDLKIITSDDPGLEHFANKPRADVVHYPFFDLFFHTLPIRPLLSGSLRSRDVLPTAWGDRQKRTVVTIHDVIPLLFPEQYPVGIRGKLHHQLQRLALSQIDAVVTDSQASKNDIVRLLNVPSDKVHVVYLAGNPEIKSVVSSQVSGVKRKYKLPQKYLLYVGDINYNKNIPELIKSLTFIDESVHLVCVGKNFKPQAIPEWQRIQLIVESEKLKDRVHFISNLGSNANQDLSAIYTGAECYVQPSLYEGFGLPVLEALQCETPVVCAKNSSLTEIGGQVVEYVLTDAKSIAKGIQIVLHSKYKTQSWKTAVRKHLENFSWVQTAKQTSQVYMQLR